MKKFLLLFILGSSLFFNVGCDSSDVAAGAVGVGVGIGLNRWWHRHHHYDRHHHRHRHGRYRYGYGGWSNYAADNAKSDVARFAAKYNISKSTAQKLKNAFDGAEVHGLDSFKSIGLDKRDLRAIASYQLPDRRSIHDFAEKLNLSDSQAIDLLQTMNRQFEKQVSNVKSYYWQTCMADGAWKTPQSNFCQSTSWNGCSPKTGATLCY